MGGTYKFIWFVEEKNHHRILADFNNLSWDWGVGFSLSLCHHIEIQVLVKALQKLMGRFWLCLRGISQNGWIGSNLWRSLSPIALLKQVHLKQVAQDSFELWSLAVNYWIYLLNSCLKMVHDIFWFWNIKSLNCLSPCS